MQRACGYSIFSSVDFISLPYFPSYLIKGTIFGNEFIEHKICFDFDFSLPEKCFILKRKERETIRNALGIHVKYPLFLPYFNQRRISSTDFRKNNQMPNLIKIRPAEQTLANRQTLRIQ
jgi:hypothetical protein